MNKAGSGDAHLNRRSNDALYRAIALHDRLRRDPPGTSCRAAQFRRIKSRVRAALQNKKINRAEALPLPPVTNRKFDR
jgi:hypothetical protein